MRHALRNKVSPNTNTGPFKNLLSFYYWSSTEYAPDNTSAWDVNTQYGYLHATGKGGGLDALAVRPGDVAAVPGPGTVALVMLGLGAVGVMRRQR